MKVQSTIALLGVMASWVIFLLSEVTTFWWLSIVSVIVGAVPLVAYFRRDGLLSPVNIAILLSSITTTITLIWMAIYVNHSLSFFAYSFIVTPRQLLWLSREQIVFMSCVLVSYLSIDVIINNRSSKHRVKRPFSPPKWMWISAYCTGIFAIVALYALSGTLNEVLSTLAEKGARNAHHGVLWLFVYFGYAGALLWFLRNRHLKVLLRYGGLLALLMPMLLSGSRGGVFATLIASAAIDERLGARIRFRSVAIFAFVIAGLFVWFAIFRENAQGTITETFFNDISMQIGYVVAVKNHIVDTVPHLETLFTAFEPLLPSSLHLLPVVDSPARHFTDSLFPWASGFTASMGLFGEAHYIFTGFAVIPYYFLVGAGLTFLQTWGQRLPVLFLGVFSGGAYRVIRGGLMPGITFSLQLLIPFFVLWIVWIVVTQAKDVSTGERYL